MVAKLMRLDEPVQHNCVNRTYRLRPTRHHLSMAALWCVGASVSGGNAEAAATAAQRLHDAHQALRADPAIQFVLDAPPPPAPPPAWLKGLGEFFEWLGKIFKPIGELFQWLSSLMPAAPWVRVLLWGVIIAAVATAIWLIALRLRGGEWRWPGRKRARVVEPVIAEDEWVPDAGQTRAWLEEADRLAADGQYAEAVHHLLFRSVEDIQRRRPMVVRPALTSRELAAASGIPASARALFARIALHVERSLFGGRDVSREDWEAARGDYADFALPKMWAATA